MASPAPSSTQSPLTGQQAGQVKVRAARLSVISNTVLVALKLAVGVSTGSVAVLSEAVHSATDLLAAVLAFFAVRASDAPPDPRHPYGHGKMESVAGVAEAGLIFVAGAYIVYHSVQALRTGHETEATGWGMIVMAVSALVNTLIARHLFAVSRRTDSVALAADAHHLSIDVYTSLGVLLGLGLVAVTGLKFLDPVVALVVALFIFKAGWEVLNGAFFPLLDERLPQQEIDTVEMILNANPHVLDWHKLRTRKSGSQRHIDVHVLMDDEMNLRDAHRHTEALEDEVRAALPNTEVIIHTEPFEEEKRHREEIPH